MPMLVLPDVGGSGDVTRVYVDTELAKKSDKVEVDKIKQDLNVIYEEVEG